MLLQEGQMEMPNYEMWVSEIRLKAQKSEIRPNAQTTDVGSAFARRANGDAKL